MVMPAGRRSFASAVWMSATMVPLGRPVAALLMVIGCDISQITKPVHIYPVNDVRDLPSRRVYGLRVPTYDGSGQAVHPDLLWLGDCGLTDGFALAFTPYPDSDNAYENPSLLTSTNGLDFSEPVPGLNPIAQRPSTGHNDDTDLVFDPITREYRIYYLETCKPDSQNVILLSSTDLISWTRQCVLHYELRAQERFILSPAVIRAPDGQWRMYYVNARFYEGVSSVEYLTSRDGITWDKDAAHASQLSWSGTSLPWHLDVFAGGGWYYSLVCGKIDRPDLYIARSRDLETWEYLEVPILTPASCGFECERVYRSTGFVSAGSLIVYFSYMKPQYRWGIGLYKIPLDQLWPLNKA